MSKNVGNLYTTTSFRHGSRRAGMGMLYDNYDDESSGRGEVQERPLVRFPNDGVDPEELNGPVIIIQKGREK